MIKRITWMLAVMIVAAAGSAFAQQYPEWSGFPPMYNVRDMVWFEGRVYGVTDGGMFSYDPEAREYQYLYKNNGVDFTHMTCIAATSHYLYVGYAEHGLWRYDPRTNGFEIIAFPEYHQKTNANPTGIAVNTIYVKNDSILYVGHANGLDRLNLQSEELRAYTHLGPDASENTPVYDLTVHHDSLWVATTQGLSVADETNPNLEFAENWRDYSLYYQSAPIQTAGVVYVEDASETTVYLAAPNSGILRYDHATDALKQVTSGIKAHDFVESAGSYWVVGEEGIAGKSGKSWAWLDNSHIMLQCIAADDAGRLWVGSEIDGLLCSVDREYIDITPVSRMRSDTFYGMSLSPDGVLWAATALRDQEPYSVIQRYDGESWSFYNEAFPSWTTTGVAVLADKPGRAWVASWGKVGLTVIEDDGLPEIDGDDSYRADPSGEIIRPTIDQWYFVCTDLARDEHGNVWIANYQEQNHQLEDVPTSGLVVVDDYPITRYAQYSPAADGLPSGQIMKICSTGNGWIWAGTWSHGLVGVYTGPDPFDKSDTELQRYTTEDGLLSMKITALAADGQGNLWAGTEAGLHLLTPGTGNRYDISDLNDIIGEGHRDILSIAVDDRNNKWIGTTGGLIKLNAQNQVDDTYTIENSGLFSNVILSLAYDTGRDVLWVGTDLGVNRLDVDRGGMSTASASVHVYPNPFELWGYDSRVVFTNLAAGSAVDIYSFEGVHVSRVTADAQETEIEWGGRNFRDAYVGSGVYYIIGTDNAGRPFRDKLILMRR